MIPKADFHKRQAKLNPNEDNFAIEYYANQETKQNPKRGPEAALKLLVDLIANREDIGYEEDRDMVRILIDNGVYDSSLVLLKGITEGFNDSIVSYNTEAVYLAGKAYEAMYLTEKKNENKEEAKKNLNSAREYYRKAAIGKNANYFAMICMGRFCEGGLGTELRDYNKALDWYEKANNSNTSPPDPEASYRIGELYYHGRVERDLDKALVWYEKAAKLEHTDAAFMAGLFYSGTEDTKETPTDYQKAFDYYKKAAEGGHGGALNNLGCLYFHGDGVHKDLYQAFYYFTKGAKEKSPVAYSNLGNAYVNGTGTEVNLQLALHYFSEAYESGLDGSQKNMDTVKEIMKKRKHQPSANHGPVTLDFYHEEVDTISSQGGEENITLVQGDDKHREHTALTQDDEESLRKKLRLSSQEEGCNTDESTI